MNFDLEKITKALEWVLAKATWLTGVCAALGALHYTAAYVFQLPFFKLPESTHATLNRIGFSGAVFFALLALTTLIVQQKKNAKQAAAIAAEQIRRDPKQPDTSAVPAVHAEIVKQTVNGEPS